jgi:hypothetical protein
MMERGMKKLSILLILCAFIYSLVFAEDAFRLSDEYLENGTCIESFMRGSLKVVFETFVDERYASTARILDAHGNALVDLRGARFITPRLTDSPEEFASQYFMDLFRDGRSELKVTYWSGGAYGMYIDLVYSYSEETGIDNVIIYEGGEGRIGKGFDDLDDDDKLNALARATYLVPPGEEKPLLLIADYGIHHVGGLTHGSECAVILKWDGARYRLANREYPQIPRMLASKYKERLAGLTEADLIDCTTVANLAGYIGNSILTGDESVALEWVQKNFKSTSLYAEFREGYLGEIESCIAGVESRIRQDESRLLYLK